MSILLTLLLVVMMSVPMMAVPTKSMAAQSTVGLGTASTFAVLAGSGISNTGSTTINGDAGGDIGLSPGSAVTGFPPGTVSGTIYAADAVAAQAQVDLGTAYNDAAGRGPVVQDLTGIDLGGLTLTPGVYHFSSSAQLTGTLTLDGQNELDPVFVFQVGSTLTTASGSNVNLINGARYCRTFWQVGSSATLGTNSDFVGHIFALTSITATTGARVQGQLLARNGAVTLDNNTITNGFCATPPAPPASATLRVIKHVINDNGRTADAADFNLHVKTSGSDVAESPAPGVESPGRIYTLAAGNYVVSEDYYDGYTVSYSGDSDSMGKITLASGDNKTVTITNNDIVYSSGGGGSAVVTPTPATLHVIKHVINDNGRTATAADFKLHVKISGSDVAESPANGVESPGRTYTLAAGTYVVSEDANAGYTLSYSGDSDSRGNITLASGDHKTVTITNDDIPAVVAAPPATLHVIKHVINDNGRAAVAADFKLHVKIAGSDVAASPATGVESPGRTYTLAAGTYVVSEDANAGYTLSYSGNSDSRGNITLASGDNKTVMIINDDIPAVVAAPPATLHVIKHVINDNGRTAVAADFKLHVKIAGSDVAASPAPGVESPGRTYTLAAGTYVVSEDANAGYTVSYSGNSDSRGNITLASGDYQTVTITNNDIPSVAVRHTVTGGQIPKTSTSSTPWYALFLIGAALTLVGALGWRRRNHNE